MTMGRAAVRCPALLALYVVCMGIWYPIYAVKAQAIINLTADTTLEGQVANITCTVSSEIDTNITWLFEGKNITFDDRKTVNIVERNGASDLDDTTLKTKISSITIANVTSKDAGNYTCIAIKGEKGEKEQKDIYLSVIFKGRLAFISPGPFEGFVQKKTQVVIFCIFEVYNASEVVWYKKDTIQGSEVSRKETPNIIPEKINSTYVRSKYTMNTDNPDKNGTYVCEMKDVSNSDLPISGAVDVIVYDKPKLIIDLLAINISEVYMNWTLYTYNYKIVRYDLFISNENGTSLQLKNYNNTILGNQTGVKNTSYVIENLKKSTQYIIKLEVVTMFHASSCEYIKTVRTLDNEPVFVPNISINGFSATSVTIGWAAPADAIKQYIHYYELEARKKSANESRQAYHPRDDRNLPYMFGDLEPHSYYVFKVRACNDYGERQRCGNWSAEMEAATLDGVPSEPTNVIADCETDSMKLSWAPPKNPKAEIKGYTMDLRGQATFFDRNGEHKETTWGPLSKFTTNDSKAVTFGDLQPNTNYTVTISAMTRTRKRGHEATAWCKTKLAPPDQPPRPLWRKIQDNNQFRFKMYLPRMSERNGRICCYRIYMVRLDHQNWNELGSPQDLPVIEYKDAHAQPPVSGAYIADILSNKKFPKDSELVLGDSETYFHKFRVENTLNDHDCRRCLEKPDKAPTAAPTTSTTTTVSTTTIIVVDDDNELAESITDDPGLPESEEIPIQPSVRRRRNSDIDYNSALTMRGSSSDYRMVKPEDGPLDPNANYTLFVELITGIPGERAMFSNFVPELKPAATPIAPQSPFGIEIALQATCGVAALVLLLMIVFCIRQTRRSRKLPPHAHLELNPLQLAYRYIMGGRTQMVPTAPPNMPPIAKEDLAAAYAERQADSDFGFQKEFELLQMLPECFPDRTTHASEARENQPKNRYPDIKAYDQTRVKLSQIDGITGSDYINANYVNGYQDRKRFICAQGPTDTTVNDFWRMIWEHGLELIVMLTNLEEYSKVKCSKYWPDEGRGARAFGYITVLHVSEKRYSDYIVRELKITKQSSSAEGQPIVDNNGVAKRNGDCKDAVDGGSVPTSPRELKDADTRIVKQYHFLMWKDFAAPEHAYSILKFIKRVNEAWSSTVVRPCVVHCSAGVGRTGTLVALDCLLEQLRCEGRVAVFNTIAELRHQRNFLVQSPKQYIFVYRALVEFAQYGDTEIPACRLKSAIDRLRNTPPGATACLMEVEFEKILNSPIPEPIKSCAAGAAEELRSKNRTQEILPYDRNRVILSPIPTREFSTYINASFIEAYDNSESFIITQDPLPNTIVDFWRMVSEHNVATIVMLSELGEGKCPRYWDDGTATYEHISVQYEESESCPYYTRRQFRLVNNKCGTTQSVVALQYQGWPTAAGCVPEVTRGLAELATAHHSHPRTMLAHCQLGTERSALFVALCILISQLRAERRVDVCSVARKVRSQRARTIDTFLHYEFLHRAILNYAELHNLLEDS